LQEAGDRIARRIDPGRRAGLKETDDCAERRVEEAALTRTRRVDLNESDRGGDDHRPD
jgi:hypothetical protein